MAKPNFQIWQNKPKLNDSGQYVQVEVSDYYSVGFDTDLTDDDLYTNFTDIGRGEGTHGRFLHRRQTSQRWVLALRSV